VFELGHLAEFPKALRMRCTGELCRANKMGRYNIIPGKLVNGFPVYRHHYEYYTFLYMSKKNNWMVGDRDMSESGWIFAKTKTQVGTMIFSMFVLMSV
jgi:hypothetical protein